MSRSNNDAKKYFIGKPAPPGYIAGVGRGATGFTTRSDLGPAREPSHQFASGSRGAGHSGAHARDNDQDEEGEYLNEANYDEFAGYKGSLFNKEDPYDDDDKEADKIYEGFDLHMVERGKALEKKQALQLEAYRLKRPKIQQQFTDLVENLKQVTEAEWINLPESGDARNRKQRIGKMDKYTPIPESLLAEQKRLASGGETLISIDPRTADHPDMEVDHEDDDVGDNQAVILQNRLTTSYNTIQNKASESGHLVNIGDMNECRSSIISTTLSQASKTVNVAQLTATNREAYLGQLSSSGQVKVTENLEERRKQYEMMLKSGDLNIKTKVYLMYIDLEEKAGKLSNARSLARKGCEECPKCVDLWCEAIRLHKPEKAKQLMIDAIKANNTSLKLWLKAVELETTVTNKLIIFEKARPFVSFYPEFWRAWAETETPEKREAILEVAVQKENCPNAIDLWLSLARIKPDLRGAASVLSRAKDQNPNDRSIPIEFARLLEKANRLEKIKIHINDAIDDFAAGQVELNREEWFKDAIQAEREGYPQTGAAIISRLHRWDLGHLERDHSKLLDLLLNDAKSFANQNCLTCARQMYRSTVDLFRGKANQQIREQAWIAWAQFEQTSGDSNRLEEVLLEATGSPETCQSSESLWLMLIELKPSDDIIKLALDKNPKCDKIVLAAVQIHCDKGSTKAARRILADASMIADSADLLKRHADMERSLGNYDEAVRLLKIGVDKYKDNPDFYLSLGEIEEHRENYKLAADHYKFGLTSCKTSVNLWINLARLREKTETIPIARSTLEKARRFNDKIAILYIESAKLEIRAFLASLKGSTASIIRRPNLAETIISEGIRKCKGQPEVSILESMQKSIKDREFAQCI